MTLSREQGAFTTPAGCLPADTSLPSRCIALLPAGDMCGRESIGNGTPLDICGRHALEWFNPVPELLAHVRAVWDRGLPPGPSTEARHA